MFKKFLNAITFGFKFIAMILELYIIPSIEVVNGIKSIVESPEAKEIEKILKTLFGKKIDNANAKVLVTVLDEISYLDKETIASKTPQEIIDLFIAKLSELSDAERGAIYSLLAREIAKAYGAADTEENRIATYKDHELDTMIASKYSQMKSE